MQRHSSHGKPHPPAPLNSLLQRHNRGGSYLSRIGLAGFQRTCRTWQDEQWFFSVVDIVGALTDSPSPRSYWTMMKAREHKQSEVQLSTLRVQLRPTSSDGEAYKTDSVNSEAATVEIAGNRDAQGFDPNKQAAQDGGTIAGNARRQLEHQSGKKVVSGRNHLTNRPRRSLPGQEKDG
jgi:hypothetical protein